MWILGTALDRTNIKTGSPDFFFFVFAHISIKSYNISKSPVYSEQIYNTKFVQNLP